MPSRVVFQLVLMIGCALPCVSSETRQTTSEELKPNSTETDKITFTVGLQNNSIFDPGEDMYNVSQEDIDYFKGLFDEVLQKFVDNYWYGQSIIVIRQEVRAMPRIDWLKFVKAVQSLKKKVCRFKVVFSF